MLLEMKYTDRWKTWPSTYKYTYMYFVHNYSNQWSGCKISTNNKFQYLKAVKHYFEASGNPNIISNTKICYIKEKCKTRFAKPLYWLIMNSIEARHCSKIHKHINFLKHTPNGTSVYWWLPMVRCNRANKIHF